MQYTIEEHEIRNHPYKDPITFIKDYICMYNKQSRVPYKVFYKDIQYSKVYEKSLLNYLIENPNLEYFIEVENLLSLMKNEIFYDKMFYEITLSIYLKGVAILLDKVILEIEKLDFKNVKVLYFYNSGNINLYKVMSKRISRFIKEEDPVRKKSEEISIHHLFWTQLINCIENIDFINTELRSLENEQSEFKDNQESEFKDNQESEFADNKQSEFKDNQESEFKDNKQSEFADNQELLKRISISNILLGDKREHFYNKKVLMDLLLKEITDKFIKTSNEERYLFMTNLTSELMVRGICNEIELEEYLKYSKNLLSCL